MADSRRIVPPSGTSGVGRHAEPDPLGRTVAAPTVRLGTERVRVEGIRALPQTIVPAQPRRRTASVYYPATDPVSGAPNAAVVWLCGSTDDADRAFPLEPGAALEVGHLGWVYGYTDGSATPTVYLLTEED